MIPLLAAVMHVALVVCVFGFVALLGGDEVIPERDAGVLLGPVMVVSATLVFAVGLIRTTREADRERRIPVLPVIGWGAGAWLAYGIVGAVLFLLGGADVFASLAFAVRHLVDPFGVAVLGISALLGLGAVALAARGPSSTV
ncbi:DUF6121 family protein [Clavibacter michiganensis]|nr:DUF6121 family protein [Clavibacter michiganensis]KAF0259411.1 hypothetical protein DOU02_03760 [Clavibacter michiganensis subsp. michiganensis]MDO4017001.1 DUF6121 family protein [Clavibacter michiganensis]MDO4024630.1 DUF6121 family protein [Clavibacter michiganensis]MDO4027706.1 DUF6121 family protein [Clavibacter michiganensis]MDO4031167.1 DUF6121 family protein [Clavibacter michiganensis]